MLERVTPDDLHAADAAVTGAAAAAAAAAASSSVVAEIEHDSWSKVLSAAAACTPSAPLAPTAATAPSVTRPADIRHRRVLFQLNRTAALTLFPSAPLPFLSSSQRLVAEAAPQLGHRPCAAPALGRHRQLPPNVVRRCSSHASQRAFASSLIVRL
jgi:hypothetical protein